MDASEAYHRGADVQFQTEEVSLGPWTSLSLLRDPKHMCFSLARYKFVAKLLDGKDTVLEVGCGDGFGLPIVAHSVPHLHCADWDERNIMGNRRRLAMLENVTYEVCDVTLRPPDVKADGAYAIDVLEHVAPSLEGAFMENICACLPANGVLVIGTPNKEAEQYSTRPEVNVQHVNLKTHDELRALLLGHFENVFMFGMNDEVVHTGFLPMAHFLWGVGVGLGDRRQNPRTR
jgi:2-polyprenyl-3-methyl-5-hydroxy-6-metoxy-1,4-benzoquinol methylase